MQKHNFSAGPSILPQTVFQQAAQAVLNFDDLGLSILEISHRSKPFMDVMEEAETLLDELLGLNKEFDILFLGGGASTQFFMTAMNYLNDEEIAGYVDTGTWSAKAIKEAHNFGKIDVVASSKDSKYNHIPKDFPIPDNLKYLHLTSNNTIFGTQYHRLPDTEIPIICDMSSDILSRPISANRYGIIYAGAQKNLGPAGVTIVLIKKNWAEKAKRTIPSMLNYDTHITKGSMFNTPPVFPIYTSLLTLRWLKENGGLAKRNKINKDKAAVLYHEIDKNPLFNGVVQTEDRSMMNVTFTLIDDDLTPKFLDLCNEAGIDGIKGHRSVGGFRASIYNAMPKSSIEVLVDVMQNFTQRYG